MFVIHKLKIIATDERLKKFNFVSNNTKKDVTCKLIVITPFFTYKHLKAIMTCKNIGEIENYEISKNCSNNYGAGFVHG